MNEQRIQVPIKAWYGDEKMELSFPEKLLVPQADRLLVCSSYSFAKRSGCIRPAGKGRSLRNMGGGSALPVKKLP